jgi:hypothetical protein
LRAALTAVSTASAPVFMGSTRAKPVSSQISWQKGPSWSLRNAREVSATRHICSAMTLTSRGWQWPWFTAE